MVRERLSSAIMESLLALTVFRDEFGASFLAMFAMLVFLKVLHWLVQDRVDYIEVTPTVSRLQHLRIASFMALLLVSGWGGVGWLGVAWGGWAACCWCDEAVLQRPGAPLQPAHTSQHKTRACTHATLCGAGCGRLLPAVHRARLHQGARPDGHGAVRV